MKTWPKGTSKRTSRIHVLEWPWRAKFVTTSSSQLSPTCVGKRAWRRLLVEEQEGGNWQKKFSRHCAVIWHRLHPTKLTSYTSRGRQPGFFRHPSDFPQTGVFPHHLSGRGALIEASSTTPPNISCGPRCCSAQAGRDARQPEWDGRASMWSAGRCKIAHSRRVRPFAR